MGLITVKTSCIVLTLFSVRYVFDNLIFQRRSQLSIFQFPMPVCYHFIFVFLHMHFTGIVILTQGSEILVYEI